MANAYKGEAQRATTPARVRCQWHRDLMMAEPGHNLLKLGPPQSDMNGMS